MLLNAHFVVEFTLNPSLLSSLPLVITRWLVLKELIWGWCSAEWSKQGHVSPFSSFGHMGTQWCDVRSVCSVMRNKPTRGGRKDDLRSILFQPRSVGVFAARTQRTQQPQQKRFDTCCLATGARRSPVRTVNTVSCLYVLLPSTRRWFDREFIVALQGRVLWPAFGLIDLRRIICFWSKMKQCVPRYIKEPEIRVLSALWLQTSPTLIWFLN